MPSVSPLMVARVFVERYTGVAPMEQRQLHHLVYLAHGWTLAVTDQPLVAAPPTANDGGPSFWQLSNHITDLLASHPQARWDRPHLWPEATDADNFTPAEIDISARVWERYRGYSSRELFHMQTGSETPWTLSYMIRGRGTQMLNTDARVYFRALAKAGRAAAA